MDVANVAINSPASSSASTAMPSPRSGAGLSSFSAQDVMSKVGQNVEVGDAVERIRTHVQSLQRNLDFSVDDSTGQVVVQVLDGDSGKVVRQIPSEDILRLAERLDEMRSLLFEAKA